MTDEARARIEALERHTELGSGFKIASLDLELRGAGDLLGAEQSGNVASVGFDLFCQMLDEAVHELRGEPVVHDVDPELSFDVDRAPARGLRRRRRRAPLALQAPRERDRRGARSARSPTRWKTASARRRPRRARLVRLMTLKTELRQLRVLGCEANAKSVTLAPARRHAARSAEDPRAREAAEEPLQAHARHAPHAPLRRTATTASRTRETMLVELSRCWKDSMRPRFIRAAEGPQRRRIRRCPRRASRQHRKV